MLHQTWIILLVLHQLGGIDSQSITGAPKVKDAKQVEPPLPKPVVSAMVPIGNGEGEEKEDTEGIRYNIPGDVFPQEGGGLGPLEQRLPDRGEAELTEPVPGGQTRRRHPTFNIQQQGTAMVDSMSESEEDRLELLIRNLPADQDLGAIAQSLREDKTVNEIIPSLPGYSVVKPDTQNQPTEEELGHSVHAVPPNKSIGPIAVNPPEGKQAGESTQGLPQNKTLVPLLQDQTTERTVLEGTAVVPQKGDRNSLNATDAPLVPTVGSTKIPDGTTTVNENYPTPEAPVVLNQSPTADSPRNADSPKPVQQRNLNDQNPGSSNDQDSAHNGDARIINQSADGANEEGEKHRPRGKDLSDPLLGFPGNQLAALHAALHQHQNPEVGNGNGHYVVLGNQGSNPPNHGWFFNSDYGYGGVQQGMMPQVNHQVAPRQTYGGVPHVVYGTVPVVGHGHGARYAPGYNLGKRPSPVQLPYIDRNGCTEPGDVTCGRDPTDVCSYMVCVLANENKNLWRRPFMRVVAEACPAGRGVLSELCNTHERILRAIGLIKDGIDNRAQHYHPQKRYTMAKDPCILYNAACAGN